MFKQTHNRFYLTLISLFIHNLVLNINLVGNYSQFVQLTTDALYPFQVRERATMRATFQAETSECS